MTIILSTKRDDFAVLAADRLLGRGAAAPDFAPKVVLHPSLPLAFAAAGLMTFPVGTRHEYVTTHLEEFANTITSAAGLVVREIAERLRVLFQPSMETERDKMQIFIALVKDGKADIGVQRVSAAKMTDDPTQFIPHCRHYVMPNEVWDFYDKGSGLEVLHDPAVTDPREVARLARELMRTGIDRERALNADGKNKTIGGDIDVVVVTSDAPPVLV